MAQSIRKGGEVTRSAEQFDDVSPGPFELYFQIVHGLHRSSQVVLSSCCLYLLGELRESTVHVSGGETGETLIGANVLVVGTLTGTITDIDGKFTSSATRCTNTSPVSAEYLHPK